MIPPRAATTRTFWLLGSLLVAACGSSSQAYVTQAGAARPLVAGSGGMEANGPAGKQRLPTASERAAIGKLMRLAERVRGLRFLRPVPVAIEDAQAVMDYARSELRAEDFQRARTVYVALGMLAPQLDVEALLISLLGEQVVGYYDARAGRLVVRDDVMVGLGNGSRDTSSQAAREVLLHELVHALQDQHLGLSAQLDDERTSDEENAFRALVEGDATLSVAAFAAAEGGIALDDLISDGARMRKLSEAIAEAAMASPLLSEAPPILREPLLSAYRDGLAYAAELYRREHSFRAIDRAHRAPPHSTEAILHPQLSPSAPAPLDLPALTALTEFGYEEISSDCLGELELRVYVRPGTTEALATEAAAGWDGDRVRIYRSSTGDYAAVWLTRWDSEDDAKQMYAAGQQAAAARCATASCARPVIARRGRQVLLLHGVPANVVAAVVDAAMPAHLDRSSRAH